MPDVRAFIDRWKPAQAAERANFQPFLTDLCDLLGVPRPDPATDVVAHNRYVFERVVTFDDGKGHVSNGFIDLYKRGAFVMEAKQGSDAPGAAKAEALDVVLPRFNGRLFAEADALTQAQLDLLVEAARADWKDVGPAIFGTLLERALDPRLRRKLGAHFTPRAYVERLVLPTVVEPLREAWQAAQAAALQREGDDDAAGARDEVEAFHRRLCTVRVLDPACGTGNFLYVALEHLKRLEGEVMETLESYGGQQRLDMTGGFTVSPEQFLGLELNPRAAAIADVVLWIGYLQWHFRTYGHARRLDPPILKNYGNIRHQDAVLPPGVVPCFT